MLAVAPWSWRVDMRPPRPRTTPGEGSRPAAHVMQCFSVAMCEMLKSLEHDRPQGGRADLTVGYS
jgi:hypothetical protein